MSKLSNRYLFQSNQRKSLVYCLGEIISLPLSYSLNTCKKPRIAVLALTVSYAF